MQPDVGLELSSDHAAEPALRPRPSGLVRFVEMSGLGLVMFGLATSRWWMSIAGAGLILGSYAIYRRRHGPQTNPWRDGAGYGDADGGGD